MARKKQMFISDPIVVGTYVRARIVVDEIGEDYTTRKSSGVVYVQMWRTNSGYTTAGTGTLHIKLFDDDKTSTIRSNQVITQDSYTLVGDSRVYNIQHSASGVAMLPITVWSTSSVANLVIPETRFNCILTPLDMDPPTVSFTWTGGSRNISVQASASDTCDLWEYNLHDEWDEGNNEWHTLSPSSGSFISAQISNLAFSETYVVRVRARKASNHEYGVSAPQTVKTLGGTILHSVSTVVADDDTVVISFNRQVIDDMPYTLQILDGSTPVLTFPNRRGSAGVANETISLTADQRQTLLEAMVSRKSFNATFQIMVNPENDPWMITSKQNALITTTAEHSAPHFSGFTVNDTNAETLALTGSSLIAIQNMSMLSVSCQSAVSRNAAIITKYTAKLGSKAVSSESTAIDYGIPTSYGDLSLTVTATDSRGYEASVTKPITVLKYYPVAFENWSMRRVNEVEAQANLSIAGTAYIINVDGTEKNTDRPVSYRFKKRSTSSFEDWSGWILLPDVTYTATGFSYENGSFGEFDTESGYDVQFKVEDTLSSKIINITLTQGTPLVSLRSKKIGINKANPESAVDVNGSIRMNGENIQGIVGGIYEDLNTVFEAGIYYTTPMDMLANHFPVAEHGILEILSFGNMCIQRFTTFDGSVYIRGYGTTWSAWRTI